MNKKSWRDWSMWIAIGPDQFAGVVTVLAVLGVWIWLTT